MPPLAMPLLEVLDSSLQAAPHSSGMHSAAIDPAYPNFMTGLLRAIPGSLRDHYDQPLTQSCRGC